MDKTEHRDNEDEVAREKSTQEVGGKGEDKSLGESNLMAYIALLLYWRLVPLYCYRLA